MEYFEKDILSVENGLIVHGTNCSGGFASGCAGQIRKKYPEVYNAFLTVPKGAESLGTFQAVRINDNLHIGNCFTQHYYGKDGKVYASLSAIRQALNSAFFWCDMFEQELHSPEIGCGLGGLSWPEVEKIFIEMEQKYPKVKVNIYRWSP